MASLSEDEKRREYFQNVSFALKTRLPTSLGNLHFLLYVQEFVGSELFRRVWWTWE